MKIPMKRIVSKYFTKYVGILYLITSAVSMSAFSQSVNSQNLYQYQYSAPTQNSTNQYQTSPSQTVSQQILAGSNFCQVVNRTLLQGNRGDDVESLQRYLNSYGYGRFNPTGIYGPVTTAAVKNFQTRNGIYPVGKVGPQTLTKMKSVWCQNVNDNGGIFEINLTPVQTTTGGVAVQWSSRGLTACTLNGQSVQTSGSATVNITSDTNFTLSCLDLYGNQQQKSIVVRANGTGIAPTISVTVTPNNPQVGQTVTANWTSQNTTYCTADFLSGNLPTSGSGSFTTTGNGVRYSIRCYGAGGKVAVSEIVVGNPTTVPGNGGTNVINTFTAQYVPNYSGSTPNVNLSWSGSGSNSCSIYRDTYISDVSGQPNQRLLVQSNLSTSGSLQVPYARTSAYSQFEFESFSLECGSAKLAATAYVNGNPTNNNGINATIVTNKSTYAIGETVYVTTTLTNNSTNAINFNLATCDQPGLKINGVVANTYFNNSTTPEQYYCTQSLEYVTLSPGQSRTFNSSYIVKNYDNLGNNSAGYKNITLSLPVNNGTTVTAQTNFTVGGNSTTNNITATVTTNKSSYNIGETLFATTVLKNNTTNAVTLNITTCDPPGLTINNVEAYRYFYDTSTPVQNSCLQAFTTYTIYPGQSQTFNSQYIVRNYDNNGNLSTGNKTLAFNLATLGISGQTTFTVGGNTTSNNIISSFSAQYATDSFDPNKKTVNFSWTGSGSNSCSLYRYSALGPNNETYYSGNKILVGSNFSVNDATTTAFIATTNGTYTTEQFTLDCGGVTSNTYAQSYQTNSTAFVTISPTALSVGGTGRVSWNYNGTDAQGVQLNLLGRDANGAEVNLSQIVRLPYTNGYNTSNYFNSAYIDWVVPYGYAYSNNDSNLYACNAGTSGCIPLKNGQYRISAIFFTPSNACLGYCTQVSNQQILRTVYSDYFTLNTGVQPTTNLSSTFKVNGQNEVTVNPGDTLNFTWSTSGAIKASSVYSVDVIDCGRSGTGPYDWDITTLSGSRTNQVPACAAGHNFKFKYTVSNVSDLVSVETIVHVRASAVLGASTFYFQNNMEIGSSIPDVLELQKVLNRLGFLGSDSLTGYYGSKTRNAVIEYQKIRGISASGVVYEYTRAALNSEK